MLRDPQPGDRVRADTAYVTRCEKCNGIDGAVAADSGNHAQRRDMLKQMIRWAVRGRRIATLPFDEVRSGAWCECRRNKAEVVEEAEGCLTT